MCIIDNLLSSAAENAGALKEIRPSSAARAYWKAATGADPAPTRG